MSKRAEAGRRLTSPMFFDGLFVGIGAMLLIALVLPDQYAEKAKAWAPPLTAVVVAYIAYQQWRTARDKIALDLYGKRFAVLQTAVRYFHAMEDRKVPEDDAKVNDARREFTNATIESRFLFDESVEALMKEFRTVAFRRVETERLMRNGTAGWPPEEVVKHNQQMNTDYMTLDKLIQKLQDALEPYLQFSSRSAGPG